MQTTTKDLQRAYNQTTLSAEGISFERAIKTPCIKIALNRVAQAINKPYIPLPKHTTKPHWQDENNHDD